MNTTEFTRWWTDAKVCFPSLDTWVCKCFPDQNVQREFLRKWSSVLTDVRLDHALEVNRLMQAGDLPWVGEYDGDKERLPQHIRRLSRKLAYDRRERQDDEPLDKLKPTSFPAKKIIARILELTGAGMPSDEAKAIVLTELPVGRPNWEPRYRCLICLDAGMVTVASQAALDYLNSDKFHECHHRESAIRCLCRPEIQQDPKRPHIVYDPTKDFKIEDFNWRPVEVARFSEWVDAKREEYWNSKRESAFDTFNQRAFAS